MCNAEDSSVPNMKTAPPHLTPSGVIEEGTIGTEGAALTGKKIWLCWLGEVLTEPIDVAPISEHLPVSQLAHGLDRVLFKYVC